MMGLFKKFGSFVSDVLFGNAQDKLKTLPRHGAQNRQEMRDQVGKRMYGEDFRTTTEMDADQAKLAESVGKAVSATRQKIKDDAARAFGMRTVSDRQDDNLWEVYQQELLEEARESERRRKQWIEDQVRYGDPLLRFLAGEMIDVVSSNVAKAQYDREFSRLYLIFKSGAWYQYYDVSESEAESFFMAGSKGGWVWDNLRIRGTVFGYKKQYAFMEYSLGGYQPKYMESQTWQNEHAAIPASGEVPENWVAGKGPYDLPWLVSRNPKLFPKAKVFDAGEEPVGHFLGKY